VTTIDEVFLVSVLCGCLSAWKGSRTAWALLASAAVSSGLIWAGVPFDIKIWRTIDILVVACIATGPLGAKDLLILSLFIPIWSLYERPYAGDGINLIVAAQLVLTLPFARLWLRAKQATIASKDWGDFDLFRALARARA